MMHIRNLLISSLSVLSLSISYPLWAQTAATAQSPDTPQTLEQAAAQRARASAMRNSAEQRYAVEQSACYKKFLVNSCLDDAKKRYTQSVIDARKVDIPAREFQREAKRADAEAVEAKRAADRPLRESGQKDQAEAFRADEAAKASEREKKQAAKAQQAAKGQQKTQADQAKRQARQEKRAKADAERAAKKAKADAREEARAAAKVPTP